METKTCRQCNNQFTVTDEDIKFLEKISPEFDGKKYIISNPTLCHECREQSRMVWRNERALYKNKCFLCGKEKILIYSSDKKYKACCNDCFWSDKWDPIDQGQDFDFNRPFFEQFKELFSRSKLWGLLGANNENSEYCNYEKNSKNCYLNYGGGENQDSYYNTYAFNGKDNIDNYWLFDCEGLYESIACNKCFNSQYLNSCENCRDCYYCQDCQSCSNCFGCIGLRHKEYYFLNQPLNETKYKNKLNEYLFTQKNQKKAIKKTKIFAQQIPHRFAKITNCENCDGDILVNCKNVHNAFLSTTVEDSKNLNIVFEGKDLLDIFSFGSGELSYNISSSGYNINRSANIFGCISTQNSYYDIYCSYGEFLFGCVGLQRKNYCVLNKQYSKEKYEQLIPKIIEHMQKTGEWGEFFPPNLSPFGYNETIANDYYPHNEKQANKIKMNWQKINDFLPTNENYYHPHEDIKTYNPKNNINAEDEIKKCISGVLQCDTSGRPYKIMPHELRQYIKMGIPIPTKHPEIRHKERFNRINPRKLYPRQCMCTEPNHNHAAQCPVEFQTTYAPDRPEKVYCEECYQKSVL